MLSLLLIPFIFIVSIFQLGKPYSLKRIITYVYLRFLHYFTKRRFDDIYNPDSTDPYKVGFFIPPFERELESPQSDAHLQSSLDEVFCYGVNSKSEYLIVRIARACNSVTEAWVHLKLANGKIYSLPKQNGISLHSDDSSTFISGGLKLQCLSPLRRWRIFFNGMLRETDEVQKSQEEKFVHVRFSFIWTASSTVYDSNIDLDPHMLATAMAEEPWTRPYPPLGRFQEVMNGYEQGGMLLGTVNVEGEDQKEIYLWGVRVRLLGQVGKLEYATATHIFGTAKNGSLFHVCTVTLPHLVKNLHTGFIVQSNTKLCPVNGCQVPPGVVQNDKAMKVKFSAGDRSYNLNVDLSDGSTDFSSSQGWSGGITMKYVTFTINEFSGHGVVMIGNLNKMPPSILHPSSLPINKILREFPMRFVVPFTNPQCQLIEVSGGKGSSLAKLTEISETEGNFVVPQGIVVTTAAYNEFIRGHLYRIITELQNIIWKKQSDDFQASCQSVVVEIIKSVMPEDIIFSIKKALHHLYREDLEYVTFAIRSSATGEDTDQMSYAGQMDTFLGVKGFSEIISAVKKCWASQFCFNAIEYKRLNGQLINTPMAVVIQEMVPCEIAGVMFTCDPVTSNPAIISISSNYGLGESVVSASSEPDTVILKRDNNGHLTITSTLLGSKKTQFVMNELSGGTEELNVSEENSQKCSLSESQALLLAKIGIMVEEKFLSHRDIEWGMVSNVIYLLQSRPVTSIDKETEFEIRHEFDSFMRQEEEYISKANIGEVMPGAMSTFGMDFLNKLFFASFQKPEFRRMEDGTFKPCPYFLRGIITTQNHMQFNLIDSMFRFSSGQRDKQSNLGKANMIAMFGRVLEDKELYEIASERFSSPPSRIAKLKQSFYILQGMLMAKTFLEQSLKENSNFHIPYERANSAEELYHMLGQYGSQALDSLFRHMECSRTSSMWNLALLTTLAEARGDWSTSVFSDFAYLLATCTKVESADVPSAIQNLAYSLSQDIEPCEFKKKNIEDALKWLQTTTKPSGVMFCEFLRKHGHRCLKEFDLNSLTWEKDPKPLVNLLQGLVETVSSPAVEKKDINTNELLSKLHIPVSWKTRLLLKFLLPRSRTAVQLREKSKSFLIKSIDCFRQAYCHLAKLLVQEGRLPDQKLMFYLSIEEVGFLLNTRNPWLINKAVRRSRAHPEMDSIKFPEITKGIPKVTKLDVKPIGSSLTMKGVPVSQGKIKGLARVINSLQEASSIKQGEILITYCTDIGWSPYFPLLSGVVTEIGGLISHGAVVAREYGLPCVVGLPGVTDVFRTGDLVLLDGNSGTLQKLDCDDHA